MKFIIGILLFLSTQAFAQQQDGLQGEFRRDKGVALNHIRSWSECKKMGGKWSKNICMVKSYDEVVINEDSVQISVVGNNANMCDFDGQISHRSRLTNNVFFAKQSLESITGEQKSCEILVTKNQDGIAVRVISEDTCSSLCSRSDLLNIQYARPVR